MKSDVAFHSIAFNCTQPRDYFINEACFGDDNSSIDQAGAARN